jgi:hypothetical protein
MSNIYIQIKAIAGTHVNVVIAEMVEMARKIDISVECIFNGVTIRAKPTNDTLALIKAYDEAIAKKQHWAAVI